MAEIDLGKVVGPQGEPGIKGDTGKEGPQGPPGPEGVVDGNSAITFSTPAAYEEPISGNSIAVLFGRFKRWISNLQDNLGQLNSLKTPDKSSAVSAVNANYDSIAQLEQDVGNPTDLTTTSKEVVGAVNELNSALNGHKIIKIKIDQTTDQYGQVFVAVGKGLTYVSTPIIIRYGDGITVDYVLTGMYYNTDTGSCSFKVRTPNGTTLTNSPVNFSCIVIGFS